MKGKIILTSLGITPEKAKNFLKKLLPSLKFKKAIIITTAAKDKDKNKWNILTKQDLFSMGYTEVEFLDLESNNNVNFGGVSTVYVCGGNTFKLLKHIKESNFQDQVIKSLKNGGVYIGASAGAIVATPTIAIAGEVEPDINEVELKDLSGLNLVNFEVLPHYSPEQDDQLEEYKMKTKNQIKLISNEDIIEVDYLN